MVEQVDRIKLAQVVCQAVLDSAIFPDDTNAALAAPNGIIEYLDQGETDFNKVVDAIEPLFRTEATAVLEERVKLLEAENAAAQRNVYLLQRDNERLVTVAGYAQHSKSCSFWGYSGLGTCDCGLKAARKALNDPR